MKTGSPAGNGKATRSEHNASWHRHTTEKGIRMTPIEAKFARLSTDHAPGQEVRQGNAGLDG
ncbi:hypothetical protein, partial [Bordetella bronchiseptica]|uniref:hypothetical protein n=1 Tax=Bordetella bronchiseptica TaxID=518 RepID=UPI00126859D6